MQAVDVTTNVIRDGHGKVQAVQILNLDGVELRRQRVGSEAEAHAYAEGVRDGIWVARMDAQRRQREETSFPEDP